MPTTTQTEQAERFREMRMGVLQMTFIEFPGYEPVGEWPVTMASPFWRGDCDDDEAISDAAMELADWALDKHPELFGLGENTDYSDYNSSSMSFAGWIGEAASVTDDRERVRQPDRGPAYGDWYENVELQPGVVVQVMFFRYRGQ